MPRRENHFPRLLLADGLQLFLAYDNISLFDHEAVAEKK